MFPSIQSVQYPSTCIESRILILVSNRLRSMYLLVSNRLNTIVSVVFIIPNIDPSIQKVEHEYPSTCIESRILILVSSRLRSMYLLVFNRLNIIVLVVFIIPKIDPSIQKVEHEHPSTCIESRILILVSSRLRSMSADIPDSSWNLSAAS